MVVPAAVPLAAAPAASGLSLGGALTILGTGLSVFSTFSGAGKAEKQARLQAELIRQQIERQRVIDKETAKQFITDSSALFAKRVAGGGGSGTRAGTGSSALVDEDFRRQVRIQADRIDKGARFGISRLEETAKQFDVKAGNIIDTRNLRIGATLLKGAKTFA